MNFLDRKFSLFGFEKKDTSDFIPCKFDFPVDHFISLHYVCNKYEDEAT